MNLIQAYQQQQQLQQQTAPHSRPTAAAHAAAAALVPPVQHHQQQSQVHQFQQQQLQQLQQQHPEQHTQQAPQVQQQPATVWPQIRPPPAQSRPYRRCQGRRAAGRPPQRQPSSRAASCSAETEDGDRAGPASAWTSWRLGTARDGANLCARATQAHAPLHATQLGGGTQALVAADQTGQLAHRVPTSIKICHPQAQLPWAPQCTAVTLSGDIKRPCLFAGTVTHTDQQLQQRATAPLPRVMPVKARTPTPNRAKAQRDERTQREISRAQTGKGPTDHHLVAATGGLGSPKPAGRRPPASAAPALASAQPGSGTSRTGGAPNSSRPPASAPEMRQQQQQTQMQLTGVPGVGAQGDSSFQGFGSHHHQQGHLMQAHNRGPAVVNGMMMMMQPQHAWASPPPSALASPPAQPAVQQQQQQNYYAAVTQQPQSHQQHPQQQQQLVYVPTLMPNGQLGYVAQYVSDASGGSQHGPAHGSYSHLPGTQQQPHQSFPPMPQQNQQQQQQQYPPLYNPSNGLLQQQQQQQPPQWQQAHQPYAAPHGDIPPALQFPPHGTPPGNWQQQQQLHQTMAQLPAAQHQLRPSSSNMYGTGAPSDTHSAAAPALAPGSYTSAPGLYSFQQQQQALAGQPEPGGGNPYGYQATIMRQRSGDGGERGMGQQGSWIGPGVGSSAVSVAGSAGVRQAAGGAERGVAEGGGSRAGIRSGGGMPMASGGVADRGQGQIKAYDLSVLLS
ncbi:MAG: hypothetical protein WDW38_001050 [Sanguina aurantia]